MKFDMGDKVKVKENSKAESGMHAGRRGTVTKVIKGESYPYCVDFGDGETLFCAIELEREE